MKSVAKNMRINKIKLKDIGKRILRRKLFIKKEHINPHEFTGFLHVVSIT